MFCLNIRRRKCVPCLGIHSGQSLLIKHQQWCCFYHTVGPPATVSEHVCALWVHFSASRAQRRALKWSPLTEAETTTDGSQMCPWPQAEVGLAIRSDSSHMPYGSREILHHCCSLIRWSELEERLRLNHINRTVFFYFLKKKRFLIRLMVKQFHLRGGLCDSRWLILFVLRFS